MRTLGTQVVVSSTILGDSLITSGPSNANLVLVDVPAELPFDYVQKRGNPAKVENFVTKSGKI